jgi:hypothetical protein
MAIRNARRQTRPPVPRDENNIKTERIIETTFHMINSAGKEKFILKVTAEGRIDPEDEGEGILDIILEPDSTMRDIEELFGIIRAAKEMAKPLKEAFEAKQEEERKRKEEEKLARLPSKGKAPIRELDDEEEDFDEEDDEDELD